MAVKSDVHVFTGMQRDLDVAKHKAEFLYDAHNIRFTAIDGDTLFCITNEKSTKQLIPKDNTSIHGSYLGHCVVDDVVVLFSKTQEEDIIYKIIIDSDNKDQYIATVLYHGNLNFNLKNPIETLGVYENENIQKVYWVDGLNQPRVIRIDSAGILKLSPTDSTQFDFVPSLELREEVTVERYEGDGMFAPGVIQYAFAYYNKYGRESNIFYTTPLHYISFPDRGGSPEDRIANSFKITITNVEKTKFDYLRIFSIHRTSIDSTPTCKIVEDIELNIIDGTTVEFVDSGTKGNTIDPTELLYIGGETIVPYTMTQKDNTLFFGNYSITRLPIPDAVKAFFKNSSNVGNKFKPKKITATTKVAQNNNYYDFNTYYSDTPGFKLREHYRTGIQFQHKSGKWSEPVFISDYTVGDRVYNTVASIIYPDKNSKIVFGAYNDLIENIDDTIDISIGETSIKSLLEANGYIKYRPVVVFPNILDRLILTQGVLNPTVFNFGKRDKDAPFVQSSWFFRPNPVNVGSDDRDLEYCAEYRHNHILLGNHQINSEVQGQTLIDKYMYNQNFEYPTSKKDRFPHSDLTFGVDQSIVTMHSPEIEYNTNFDHLDYEDTKCRLIGITQRTSNVGALDLSTSSPAMDKNYAAGFEGPQVSGIRKGTSYKNYTLMSWYDWNDVQITIGEDGDYTPYIDSSTPGNTPRLYHYPIYPWQKSGSLNNDVIRPADKGAQTAVLENKVLSNLNFCGHNLYFNHTKNLEINKPSLFSSDQVSLIKLPYLDWTETMKYVNYEGNIDTVIYNDSDDTKLHTRDTWWKAFKYRGHVYNDNVHFSSSFSIGSPHAEGETEVNSGYPIRMKYKSTRHLVFSLHQNNDGINRMPIIYGKNTPEGGSAEVPFWFGEENSLKEYLNDISFNHENTIQNSDGTPIVYVKKYFNDYISNVDSSNYSNLLTAENVNKDGLIIAKNPNNSSNSNAAEYLLYTVVASGNNNPQEYTLAVNYNNILDGNGNHKVYIYINNSQGGNTLFFKNTNGTGGYLQLGGFQFTYNPVTYDPDDTEEENPISINSYLSKEAIRVHSVDIITGSDSIQYPYLYLAELYREPNSDIDFGGNTEEAIKNNLWLPAGEPKPLTDKIELLFEQGDTWYQRYDCLKTYPFTEKDENSIVEIGSFLCETRINLDGRYDRHRGDMDNRNNSPINFGKLNEVYSQNNDFFNYRILDRDYYTLNKFSNTITWTKAKTNAAIIDLWTNVTAAETFDLDGTKGKINALRTFNDKIYGFQDNALSLISFNPRVQINTSDGVPIEITNSKKMEGKIYISDIIGCTNKWTIAVTPAGIYFMDSNSKEFYNIGQQLGTVSGTHGFSNWFKGIDVDKYRTFYDYNDKDLYILDTPSNNIDNSLVFSENLGQFTSFMNYGKADAMFNINNDYFAFSNSNMYRVRGDDESYNTFFGDTYPFDLTFISNADASEDKIFTNLEMRADFYVNGALDHRKNFDYIQVYNEYQNTGVRDLTFNYKTVSNLKKKFRIWRIDIPRALKSRLPRPVPGLNRIRNTWATIKLGMKAEGDENIENLSKTYMKLHDLVVQYHI